MRGTRVVGSRNAGLWAREDRIPAKDHHSSTGRRRCRGQFGDEVEPGLCRLDVTSRSNVVPVVPATALMLGAARTRRCHGTTTGTAFVRERLAIAVPGAGSRAARGARRRPAAASAPRDGPLEAATVNLDRLGPVRVACSRSRREVHRGFSSMSRRRARNPLKYRTLPVTGQEVASSATRVRRSNGRSCWLRRRGREPRGDARRRRMMHLAFGSRGGCGQHSAAGRGDRRRQRCPRRLPAASADQGRLHGGRTATSPHSLRKLSVARDPESWD